MAASSADASQALDAIAVTGAERLVWDQAAASVAKLAGLRFVIYLDDEPIPADGVVCETELTPAGFTCSSPLPTMMPGAHIVTMSTLSGDTESESERSAPINLMMATPQAGAMPPNAGERSFITRDGIRLIARVVATGLEDATDVSVLDRGRILIAERSGRIRMFQPASGSLVVAATLPDVEAASPGSGLLAIAASVGSDEAGQLHVVYTSATGGRLGRFAIDRTTGLSSRATLLDGLPVSTRHPRVSLKIGPDQKLYLAIDDGGSPERVADAGSINGKVLRLNLDGTTPADAAGLRYGAGVNRPTAMAWSTDGSVFWTAGSDSKGLALLQRSTVAAKAATEVTRIGPPSSMGELAMIAYRGDMAGAMNGDLLVAGSASRSLLRVKILPSGAINGVEWLFDDSFDDVRAMAVDPSGVVYICSGSVLHRVTVQP